MYVFKLNTGNLVGSEGEKDISQEQCEFVLLRRILASIVTKLIPFFPELIQKDIPKNMGFFPSMD